MIKSGRERQAPTKIKDAEPSHLTRYKFAKKKIKRNKIILDAPTGLGYGTAFLSNKAKKVYGVDIHKGAIQHAKEFFQRKNIQFIKANIQNLKKEFPTDESIDTIVSFEGIEHLKNPEAFLKECKRVLKTGGKLIISTPRKPHGNPYHTIEYSLDEFKAILLKHFAIKEMYGQTYTKFFRIKGKKLPPKETKLNFIAICEKA